MDSPDRRRMLDTAPTVKTEMLIRRPVGEVFRAFTDPAVTTRFWFTKSTGPLKPDAKVEWSWEMHGVSCPVHVKELVPDERILIDWNEDPTEVEWRFQTDGDTTFVTITESGFSGSGDEVVAAALDSTKGFTFVLAGLKALLEHDVELKLVADYAPPTFVS